MRRYNTDPGYITVPEANKLVLRILRIIDENEKSYYKTILEKAKKGSFGGKKYKKRMYQVRKNDILEYAKSLLQEQQLNIYDLKLASDLKSIDRINNLPKIDKKTVTNIKYFLSYLYTYEILSDTAFQDGMEKLYLLLKLNPIILQEQ